MLEIIVYIWYYHFYKKKIYGTIIIMQYFTWLSSNKILTSVLFQQKQKVLGDYNNGSQPTMSLVFKRRIRHGQKNRKNRFLKLIDAYLKKKNRIFYVIKGDNKVYTIPIEVP